MSLYSSKIDAFFSLNPRQYNLLLGFQLTRSMDVQRYDIDIILGMNTESSAKNLRIRCTKAFNIKIGEIEGFSGLLINVDNIRDRQLEGGTYRVSELEEKAFSFYCEDFFAELVAVATNLI